MKPLSLASIFLAICTQGFTAYTPFEEREEESVVYEAIDSEYEDKEDDSIVYQEMNSRSSDGSNRTTLEQNDNFMPGINTPAMPFVKNGCGLSVTGEVLYWQASMDDLYYASKLETNLTNGNITVFDPFPMKFKWDVGFRVGAGYTFKRDSWDIALDWTHIKNHSQSKETVSPSTNPQFATRVGQTWAVPGEGIATPMRATGKWRVNLNQVDLQLGRDYYVGRRLTLRPNVGARTVFIHQKFTPSAYNDLLNLTSKATLKTHFWGFGFLAGMNTDWLLGCGFSIFGDAAFSLLCGNTKINEVVQSDGFDNWQTKSSSRLLKPVFDIDLGVKWSSAFCDDQLGLTFKAGYEYHLYMNQNAFHPPGGSVVTLAGDLGYQGVTGSVRLDF